MFDPRNNLSNEVSAQLIMHFGDKVFRTVIPRNVRLAEAPSFGKAAMYHDKDSRGALAYLALAGELIRREEEAQFGTTTESTDSGDSAQRPSGIPMNTTSDPCRCSEIRGRRSRRDTASPTRKPLSSRRDSDSGLELSVRDADAIAVGEIAGGEAWRHEPARSASAGNAQQVQVAVKDAVGPEGKRRAPAPATSAQAPKR
jgi:hypothetical protein